MKLHLVFIILICILSSCGRPECKNTNPVFDQYAPDANEYKTELLNQLKQSDPTTIHYWVDKYIERNGKPFMTLFVESDHICAKGILDIKNPNKLQKFKNARGLSYFGKEINGLQYAVDTIDGKIVLLFEEGKIAE